MKKSLLLLFLFPLFSFSQAPFFNTGDTLKHKKDYNIVIGSTAISEGGGDEDRKSGLGIALDTLVSPHTEVRIQGHILEHEWNFGSYAKWGLFSEGDKQIDLGFLTGLFYRDILKEVKGNEDEKDSFSLYSGFYVSKTLPKETEDASFKIYSAFTLSLGSINLSDLNYNTLLGFKIKLKTTNKEKIAIYTELDVENFENYSLNFGLNINIASKAW